MGKKCRYAKTWMNDIYTHCYCYCTSLGRSDTSIKRQGFYKDEYPNTGCKDQFGTSGWWSLCMEGGDKQCTPSKCDYYR